MTLIEICFGLASSRFGQGDAQHAVLVLRLDLLRVDHGGQGEGAGEGAVGALHAVVALLLHLVVELALAAQGQHVVLDADVDVLRVDARQLGLQDDVAVLLVDVHRGRPGRRAPSPLRRRPRPMPRNDSSNMPVHPVLQAHQVTERLPANDCHVHPPPSSPRLGAGLHSVLDRVLGVHHVAAAGLSPGLPPAPAGAGAGRRRLLVERLGQLVAQLRRASRGPSGWRPRPRPRPPCGRRPPPPRSPWPRPPRPSRGSP